MILLLVLGVLKRGAEQAGIIKLGCFYFWLCVLCGGRISRNQIDTLIAWGSVLFKFGKIHHIEHRKEEKDCKETTFPSPLFTSIGRIPCLHNTPFSEVAPCQPISDVSLPKHHALVAGTIISIEIPGARSFATTGGPLIAAASAAANFLAFLLLAMGVFLQKQQQQHDTTRRPIISGNPILKNIARLPRPFNSLCCLPKPPLSFCPGTRYWPGTQEESFMLEVWLLVSWIQAVAE